MKRLNRFKLIITFLVLGLVFPSLLLAASTATLTPNPKFTAMDSNGDPYVGGKLYTFETGTTTAKASWTDSTKGTPNTNPVVLDNRGQADIWIDSSGGAYRFRLDSADDVTIWTADNINDLTMSSSYSTLTLPTKADSLIVYDDSANEVKKLAILNLLGNVHYPDYNEADQGIAGSGSSVKTFVDVISADSATLVFRHNSGAATTTYTFGTSETIPSNINIAIEKGAILNLDVGVVLTLGSQIEAGNYQILSGAGSPTFASGSKVKSAWFSDFETTITKIGTDNVELEVSVASNIANDCTVNANTTLYIHSKGRALTIADTKTLTINSSFNAEIYQVFSGAGSVVFGDGSVKGVYSEWWGAIPDDSIDCTDAINSALETGLPVMLLSGTYKTLTTINLKSRYSLWGLGREETKIKYYGNAEGIKNDAILTDYVNLKGFKIENAGTGTAGLSLGHCRRGLFEDIIVFSFDIGVSLDKTTLAIANYYNSFENVLTYGSTLGWVFGHVGDAANVNRLFNCQSYNDTTGLSIVSGVGNHIYGMHIEGATDAIVIAAGNSNIIHAYIEASTNAGSASATTYSNRLSLYCDGTAVFVDNGWNHVSGGEERTDMNLPSIHQHQSSIIATVSSEAFVAATKNIFKITMGSSNSAVHLVLCTTGYTAGVNNWAGVQTYDLLRNGGAASTVTQKTTTGDNRWTTSVAGAEITFILAGHAAFESLYAIGVQITGIGGGSTGVRELIKFERL